MLVLPDIEELFRAITMICFQRDATTYKHQTVLLMVLGKTHNMLVRLAINLPNPMTLGSDWLYIKEVMREVASEPGTLRSPHYISWPDEGLTGRER